MPISTILEPSLSMQRLKELLDYDPETGVFRWKRRRGRGLAGAIAGKLVYWGHRKIGIDGRSYRAHRLAWFYVYGRWPKGEIDHINGVSDDNRIDNLREATRAENMRNLRGAHRDSVTGFRGVRNHPQCFIKPFQARVVKDGREYSLGYYATPEEAAGAASKARRELFGEFA